MMLLNLNIVLLNIVLLLAEGYNFCTLVYIWKYIDTLAYYNAIRQWYQNILPPTNIGPVLISFTV